jgi:uncharacterized repeat protein (TIGR02543 family)
VNNGERASEPAYPTRILTAGLYEGALTSTNYKFDGWFTENNTQWNFNSPITDNITLTAKWTAAVKVNTVAENDLSETVNYVNENIGHYTLLIDKDITTGPQMLQGQGINLTIIGIGSERTIQYDDINKGAAIFLITDLVSLILEKNITLKNIEDRDVCLVWVEADSSLTMKAGSTITGISNLIVGVYHGKFDMNGGSISSFGTDGSAIRSYTNNTKITISGGTLTANSDVIQMIDGTITMSGNPTLTSTGGGKRIRNMSSINENPQGFYSNATTRTMFEGDDWIEGENLFQK